jgi:hypothetical protein
MKLKTSILAGLLLIGSLGASTAMASDGLLLKEEVWPGSNYCHMQFKAIQPLFTYDQNLVGPTSADIIDFYGSCDESPTGPDQAWEQKLDHQRVRDNAG